MAGGMSYLDTPHAYGKINAWTGDYLEFGGVTCIANVADRYTNRGWAHAYEFIESDPMLSQYYTPLPVSSYHMTIHPMFTVADVPGSTPRVFDAKLNQLKSGFTQFYDELHNNPYKPKGKLKAMFGGGIIVIAVDLNPEDQKRAEGLRSKIHDFLGLDPIDRYRQHITLAYRRTTVEPKDEPGVKQSLNKLRKILDDEVLVNSGGKLKFESAELMLFHDMALFQPTDPRRWGVEPLGDLPFTPVELTQKVKPKGWVAPWL